MQMLGGILKIYYIYSVNMKHRFSFKIYSHFSRLIRSVPDTYIQ